MPHPVILSETKDLFRCIPTIKFFAALRMTMEYGANLKFYSICLRIHITISGQ